MAAQRELSLDVARGSLPAAATCPGSLSRCWCAGLGPAMPPQLSTVRFPCTAARRDLGWDAAGRMADAHPQAHWGLAAPGYSQDNQKTSVGGEQKKKAVVERADLCQLGSFDSAQEGKDTSGWQHGCVCLGHRSPSR